MYSASLARVLATNSRHRSAARSVAFCNGSMSAGVTAAANGNADAVTPATATQRNSRPFRLCRLDTRTPAASSDCPSLTRTTGSPARASRSLIIAVCVWNRAQTAISDGATPAATHALTVRTTASASASSVPCPSHTGRSPCSRDRYPESESGASPVRSATGSPSSSARDQRRISSVER